MVAGLSLVLNQQMVAGVAVMQNQQIDAGPAVKLNWQILVQLPVLLECTMV